MLNPACSKTTGSKTAPDQPFLRAQNIRVHRGGTCVLDHVNLEVHPGELLVLLGPNGAGKSTLLRALAGLLPIASESQIMLDGKELNAWQLAQRAQRLAFVPQQSQLDSALPVEDVIAQGRYAHANPHKQTHQQAVFAAAARTHTLPFLRRAYTTLSHGEKARVLLARALATEAPLLLLDEPTAALDIAHALDFFTLLQTLRDQGHALVVVLHDLNAARLWADRVLLLHQGHAIATGAPEDIVHNQYISPVYGITLLENNALGYQQSQQQSEQP